MREVNEFLQRRVTQKARQPVQDGPQHGTHTGKNPVWELQWGCCVIPILGVL